MGALQAAKVHSDEYQRRINLDTNWDIEQRARHEDIAYKQAMMQAAIAQAEALEKIASILALPLETTANDEAQVKQRYLTRK